MGDVSFSALSRGGDGGRGPSHMVDNLRTVKGTVTFSDDYATGGDALSPGDAGLTEVRKVVIDPSIADNDSGLSVGLGGTSVSPTLLAYDGDETEVTSSTDLSSRQPVPVWLMGK